MQTEDNKLAKFISVLLQRLANSYGWEVSSKNCFGDKDEHEQWILHSKTIANFRGESGGSDCWKIETWNMNKWSNRPDWWPWNQSFDYYRKHGISAGKNAVIVAFLKSTSRKLLWAYYGFNPQVDGNLTYSENRNWQKHRYYQDEKRADYIEEKKRWAERWRLKVADGIKGKLPVQPVQSVADRLAKLQQLLDAGVISVQDFEKKKQEILDGL